MAASVITYVKAASAYLDTLNGMPCQAAASRSKSEHVISLIQQMRTMSTADATAVSVLVRSASFSKAHADAIISVVAGKVEPASQDGRRDLQRWKTCHQFGTSDLWEEMYADPACERISFAVIYPSWV